MNILDPFTGTGTFIVNLLQDEELMPADKLPMKYRNEIWCNEILLLAYYIATINIEYAYHSRVPGEYVPFEGAVLTDTFQMHEEGDTLDLEMFTDNTERIMREMEMPIHVIVGNPPYSAGQESAEDNNANDSYPTLDKAIEQTYAALSGKSTKSALYDSYIRAFRWASNRIEGRGIIAFVTNGMWLENKSFDGFRRSLAKEFNSIYVFNLRGNQRTQGEQSRKEGGKIFGGGSRAPIAITMLVKNPASKEQGVLHYHDIGDYLDRETKLEIVASSIKGEPFDWDILALDKHGDWLNQRDDTWYEFAPLGLEKHKNPEGVFEVYSAGVISNRDTWSYSFCKEELERNTQRSLQYLNSEIERYKQGETAQKAKDFVSIEPTLIKWDDTYYTAVEKKNPIDYKPTSIQLVQYRPFTKEWAYVDKSAVWSQYKQEELFLDGKENLAIAIVGTGTTKQFSTLMVDILPERQLMGNMQCFPLYWYERQDSLGGMFADESDEYIRHDAITDEALEVFCKAYPRAFDAHGKTKARTKADGGVELTKEDIFYYIYGILHSPEYRQRFEANLKKELPRIPLAEDFRSFSLAGRRLADLHLNYETVESYPLTVCGDASNPGRVQKMKWGKRKDLETGKKVDDHTTLIYNESLTFSDIPEAANEYKVNGRSPLEWMIDRYQVKKDSASGIVNDPNDYSEDPTYISGLIPRLVTVSIETLNIISALPPLNEKPQPADWPFAWKVGE